MTKQDLVNAVHARLDAEGVCVLSKKDTGAILDIVFDVAAHTISVEEKFTYPGFGTFTKKHRKERRGANPKTGEALTIPASNTVSFKPAPVLKRKVN